MAKLTAEFRQSALRRGILVKTNQQVAVEPKLYNAASIEMANLGFIVAPAMLEGMSTPALEAMLADARTVIGADRAMTPIYPGFPKQVEELSTLTLLVEQIMHYWTGGAFLPDYPTLVREGLPIEDMLRHAREVQVLPAAATARELIHSLVTDSVALSDGDKEILKGAIELQHPTLENVAAIVGKANNGENVQTFIEAVANTVSYSGDDLLAAVTPLLKNTDQLLRVIFTLSSSPAEAKWQNNYELAVNHLSDTRSRAVRMGKLSRPVRRLIVKRLGELSRDFAADRLVARRNLWRKVMKTVHPYDYALSEHEKRAVDIIHSNVEYRTLNSLVEEAMVKRKAKKAIKLLSAHQPGNLLRRAVALLRLVKNEEEAQLLADSLATAGARSAVTTLVSAYNGIISANDDHARVTRVAGLTNTMVNRTNVTKVKASYLKLVLEGLERALEANLASKTAPKGPVAVLGSTPVPLVRRDAAVTDRVLDRGMEMAVAGEGDILRIFGHWTNNQKTSGYMDIGVVLLDENFEQLAVSTWNTWSEARSWSTYSGDKHVYPGDSAPEFIDVKLAQIKKEFPQVKWAAMTVQSWSGWPIVNVDFIAGAMLRSDAEAGEVFDARAVTTAFKPTTESTQAVPFAVNLETGALVWIDSSNGSKRAGDSSSNDQSIGSIVYDELARPRLTFGELGALWAKAHKVTTVDEPVDREMLLSLLA